MVDSIFQLIGIWYKEKTVDKAGFTYSTSRWEISNFFAIARQFFTKPFSSLLVSSVVDDEWQWLGDAGERLGKIDMKTFFSIKTFWQYCAWGSGSVSRFLLNILCTSSPDIWLIAAQVPWKRAGFSLKERTSYHLLQRLIVRLIHRPPSFRPIYFTFHGQCLSCSPPPASEQPTILQTAIDVR